MKRSKRGGRWTGGPGTLRRRFLPVSGSTRRRPVDPVSSSVGPAAGTESSGHRTTAATGRPWRIPVFRVASSTGLCRPRAASWRSAGTSRAMPNASGRPPTDSSGWLPRTRRASRSPVACRPSVRMVDARSHSCQTTPTNPRRSGRRRVARSGPEPAHSRRRGLSTSPRVARGDGSPWAIPTPGYRRTAARGRRQRQAPTSLLMWSSTTPDLSRLVTLDRYPARRVVTSAHSLVTRGHRLTDARGR